MSQLLTADFFTSEIDNQTRLLDESFELLTQKPASVHNGPRKMPSRPVIHSPLNKEEESLILKRKREEEEQWERSVRRRVDEERISVQKKRSTATYANAELYCLFNDLAGMSADFGVNVSAPEIVVVGMQSDGKSSFIEGLLGFQFNLVDTNIGTRRPLVLQMVNDPSRRDARCRFRHESVVGETEDSFEEREIPVSALSSEIIRRTESIAGRDKNMVSSKPIFLRVEFNGCANLTIIDTPGFRLGGDETLQRDIEEMVMELIRPPHRIIVCLEQSTVEWANTLSRPLVRRIDPLFTRTIIVNTKFDNRVKELRDAESANKYLCGEGLPDGKRPFFISMPLRRNLDPQRFRDEIDECYFRDYQELLWARFNEPQFINNLGFPKLKEHLELLLQRKYEESVNPTFHTLEQMCSSVCTNYIL
eukprot:TRINITY_DN4719_c0_g1_i5.p1 TRINITY_DN4719_c0_g1~~TRINITY_DN4719_c0_g1_i5.p1  ORF type:complete len:420 (-),score=58.56 TRINITY_DN4719_c0_g1_i5:1350-2609(-)